VWIANFTQYAKISFDRIKYYFTRKRKTATKNSGGDRRIFWVQPGEPPAWGKTGVIWRLFKRN